MDEPRSLWCSLQQPEQTEAGPRQEGRGNEVTGTHHSQEAHWRLLQTWDSGGTPITEGSEERKSRGVLEVKPESVTPK